MNLKAGMIIESIDGETLIPAKDYAQYLNRKGGKNILLEIFDPSTNSRRELTVKTRFHR